MNKFDIIKMTPDQLNRAIAEAKGMDVKHLDPCWKEGSTEDGEDGWDGFFCPRCNCPDYLYEKEICVPCWATSLDVAWELMGDLKAWLGEAGLFTTSGNSNWICYWLQEGDQGICETEAVTPEIAICQAWLMLDKRKKCYNDE